MPEFVSAEEAAELSARAQPTTADELGREIAKLRVLLDKVDVRLLADPEVDYQVGLLLDALDAGMRHAGTKAARDAREDAPPGETRQGDRGGTDSAAG